MVDNSRPQIDGRSLLRKRSSKPVLLTCTGAISSSNCGIAAASCGGSTNASDTSEVSGLSFLLSRRSEFQCSRIGKPHGILTIRWDSVIYLTPPVFQLLETWRFWNHEEALEFCRQAKYPIVLKLAQGVVSQNVKLVADRTEAEFWVSNMFGEGVDSLTKWPPPIGWRDLRKRLGGARRMLLGQPLQTVFASLVRGYVLFQEFLPGNEFDTRISVIGDRAFGFRRHNRPGDFRASGSGRIDWDHTQIPPEKVNLAFRTARALQSQCLAMDILHAADRSLSVNEVSCYFEFWAVEACPGHWRADGTWVSGAMKAEDAVFQSFIEQVRKFARTNGPLDAPPPASAVV